MVDVVVVVVVVVLVDAFSLYIPHILQIKLINVAEREEAEQNSAKRPDRNIDRYTDASRDSSTGRLNCF